MKDGIVQFTKADVGCIADGAFGHQHIRETLADLVESCVPRNVFGAEEAKALIAALRGPMSDDAAEEDEAIEVLNLVCEDGVCFEFQDGDLVLSEGEIE